MAKDEVETVKVTIKVPKPIADFLKEFANWDLKKYCEDAVVKQFGAHFDHFRDDPEVFSDLDEVAKRFKVEPYLI